MGEFVRDPAHWLRRLAPEEWIRAGLGELGRARKAVERGDSRGAAAGLKRAAGMALNAALLVEPEESWGRTYVEHLEALAVDARVPEAVRAAAREVLGAGVPSGGVVRLRTPKSQLVPVDAAHDVIAHAWAVVKRHETIDS
jgi:HEPN domain-containing protein